MSLKRKAGLAVEREILNHMSEGRRWAANRMYFKENGVLCKWRGNGLEGVVWRKVDSDLIIPFTKNNSRRIIDLNIRCKTIKLLEDNIGENLDDLGFGDEI